MKVLLINPNTNPDTTRMMLDTARSLAPADWQWVSLTAARGATLIDCKEALDIAAAEVTAMADQVRVLQPDAVIVAAFGDPGLAALRHALDIPVFGIGESAMKAADARGQPFSVLTITPRLCASTLSQIERYGCGTHFNSLVVTEEDAAATSRDHDTLVARVKQSIHIALHEHGSTVLVIGGGPVAAAARTLDASTGVTVIQPLLAAIEDIRNAPRFLTSSPT